jgi:hypothetical protein
MALDACREERRFLLVVCGADRLSLGAEDYMRRPSRAVVAPAA